MSVSTRIDQARTRVQVERDSVAEKTDAFGAFISRVADLPAEPTPSAVGATAAAGARLHMDSMPTDRCRAVRTAFAETVRPHSTADVDGSESLLETVREEFTDTIAVALAPTTEASFTPELKQMLLTNARARRAETTALHEALDREETQLAAVSAAVDEVTAWLVEANETPLTDHRFDALEQRHEALTAHRDRCETLARRRQRFLRETTNNGLDATVHHERLIPYLYQDFSVDHPVLSTLATLDTTCKTCQRTVRDHLVRRA